jgi:hypothetical protein
MNKKNCKGTGKKNTSLPTTASDNDQPPQVVAPASARPVPPPAPSHGGANGNKVPSKKSKQQPKKKRRKRRALFVLKLYQFLQSGQNATIVSWYKDAFVVWKKQEFTEHILPMLYSHTNFSSFERQMNFYSFKKMAVSAELPSKKRMKRTDPAKFKHRLFHQNASLEQINKICRSTSCHQTRQVKETRLIMRSRNSKMNNNISELEGEVTSLPVLSPPVQVQVQVARARALTTELPAEGTANRRHRVIMATQCCPRFCSIAAGELGNESLDNLDTFTFDVDGAVSLVAGESSSVAMHFEYPQEHGTHETETGN